MSQMVIEITFLVIRLRFFVQIFFSQSHVFLMNIINIKTMSKTLKDSLHLPSWFYLGLLLTLFLGIATCQQCLLQTPIKDSCFIKIAKQTQIQNTQPQIAQQLCIILSENLDRITQLQGENQITKIAAICSKGQKLDSQLGYYVLKLHFMKKDWINAIMKEYEVFFKFPFEHEKKLSVILSSVNSSDSQNNNVQQLVNLKHHQFAKAINFTYHEKYNEALNSIQQYIKTIQQKQQKDREDIQKLIYAQYLKFRCLEKVGRFNEALQMLKQLLKIDIYEKDFYIHHLLGNFYMHHLKFEQAINHFKMSISLRSRPFLFSYYNIGLCFQKIGRNEQSIMFFQKVTENLQIPNQQAYNALGLAYFLTASQAQQKNMKTKNYLNQAEKLYIRALQINQNYTIALYNMGALKLHSQKNNEAIYFFNKAIKIDPQFKSVRYGKIKALYNQKDLKNELFLKQIDDFLHSLPSQKINAEVYSEIVAIIKEKSQLQGKWSKIALKYADQGLKISQNQDLLSLKGQILYYQQKYQQSEQNFLKAISLGGRKAHVYFNCGMAQFSQKKYEEAIMSFKLAQQIQFRQQTKQMIELAEKKIIALDL